MSCLIFWLVFMTITRVAVTSDDPVSNQIVQFKKSRSEPVGFLSVSSGMKIDKSTASTSLNTNLLRNPLFVDTMGHLVHERLPERVVHAKGSGAFGYFEVTHDISGICKAILFSKVGKRTPIAVRFSLIAAELGGSDSLRDNRGFAVKFYTEDGNFDIVGLATPTFPFKEPLITSTFMHAIKRNPATHLLDPNMLWDFLTLNPESLNTFLRVFGDEGVPNGYRYMPGFGVHTFQVVNKHGDSSFIRFHFVPDAGIQYLRSEDAFRLGGEDPDYATRDLYNAIANRNYPSWTVSVQVLSMDDVKNATFDVFDVTKKLPQKKYPLRPLGRLVLNKNPLNYFAEIEQLAFCPGNLVPGVLGSPDKLFETRILAYKNALNYRLGVNFNKITVNKPINKPFTINRDGAAPVDDNESDTPNFFRNSFNGVEAYIEQNKVDMLDIHEEPADNFQEICELYNNEFTDDERTRLIDNIVTSLGPATRIIQNRAVGLFSEINFDFGRRVQEGLQMDSTTNPIHPLIKNVP